MSLVLRFSVVLILGTVLAFVPACSNKKSDKIKIAVVTNCTDPFWDLCEAGAKKASQEFKQKLAACELAIYHRRLHSDFDDFEGF